MVTGGVRGVGLRVADWLLATSRAQFVVLLARTAPLLSKGTDGDEEGKVFRALLASGRAAAHS